MANSLTNFLAAGNLPDLADNPDLMKNIEGQDGGAPSDLDYLTFSGLRDTYAVGRDKVTPDPDEIYLIDPRMTGEGFVCWKGGGAPIDRKRWPMAERDEKEVFFDDLEDHGPYKKGSNDGWKEEITLMLIRLSDKKQIAFAMSNASGRNAFNDLLKECVMRARAGEAQTLPVCTLSSTDFLAHDKVNFKPVFELINYASVGAAGSWLADEMSQKDFVAGKEPKAKRARRKAA